MKVFVTVGIGGWKASETVDLVACPHVGDTIEVKGITVTCERVHITEKAVFVEEIVRFTSEKSARAYFK
jgi:hypothetical protein